MGTNTKERFLLHAPAAAALAAVRFSGPSGAPTETELREAIGRAVRRFGGLCGRWTPGPDGNPAFLPGEPVPDIAAGPLESEYDWFETVESLRALPPDPFTGELSRFRLLLGEGETVLVCALHSVAGDARSLLLLLESIGAALAHPELPLKALPRQTAEPEALIGKKLSGMPAMMVGMCNKRWAQQGRPFTREDAEKLREKDRALPAPVVCFREFSPERSRAIRRVCKDHGIEAQDAAAAALALAWRSPCETNLTLSLRPEAGEGFGDLSTAAAIALDPRGADLLPLAETFARNRRTAEADPAKKYFLMRFLAAADPGLLDAVWYQTYGLVRHPMVGQMADLLSFGSHARAFALTDGGALSPGEGPWRMDGLRLLAAHLPDALCTAALALCGDSLTVTLQFADDEAADGNAERFEDAMDLLEEMTVE